MAYPVRDSQLDVEYAAIRAEREDGDSTEVRTRANALAGAFNSRLFTLASAKAEYSPESKKTEIGFLYLAKIAGDQLDPSLLEMTRRIVASYTAAGLAPPTVEGPGIAL